jgi:succinoglycan biosynthesis protein ExoA
MSEALPLVTVIVAARPGDSEVVSVQAAQKFDYPPDRLEIIVARGRQPAIQRNRAVKEAKGELIYFLDDDSIAPADNLKRGVQHFLKHPQAALLGGPNVCPKDAPDLEQAFAQVMASFLAFGPSRARYASLGQLRASSEKELILCNMMMRRQEFLAAGGFDEALYPNEENALMDSLQKQGFTLLYDPAFLVERRPRRDLKSFAKMLMTYGRGRAEQFRVNPTLGSAPNFVPPLFCLYLLALPFLPKLLWWPLFAYFLAVFGQTLALPRGLEFFWPVAPLIMLSHVSYGFGFWRGLFTRLKTKAEQAAVEVVLERINPS